MHEFVEKEGKSLESEMNSQGPGEAMFVKVDVTKEEDIKVRPKFLETS